MAEENVTSSTVQRAAEALRTLQTLNTSDIQRLASLSSSSPQTTTSRNSHRYGENSVSPLREELSQRFPTLTYGMPHRSRSVGGQSLSKRRRAPTRSVSSLVKRGRPASKSFAYKDLVIIPDPQTSRVPTHKNRVELEKKGLVVSEFPFDKSWDPTTLKEKVKEQLPMSFLPFEFVKVRYTICFL